MFFFAGIPLIYGQRQRAFFDCGVWLMMQESDLCRIRQQVSESSEYVERLKLAFHEEGLSPVAAERALRPALSFHLQLQAELEQLERTRNG